MPGVSGVTWAGSTAASFPSSSPRMDGSAEAPACPGLAELRGAHCTLTLDLPRGHPRAGLPAVGGPPPPKGHGFEAPGLCPDVLMQERQGSEGGVAPRAPGHSKAPGLCRPKWQCCAWSTKGTVLTTPQAAVCDGGPRGGRRWTGLTSRSPAW